MRVRTRSRPRWSGGRCRRPTSTVDVDAFTAWLVDRQHAEGGPLLDRDRLIAHAHRFAKSPALT